MSLGKRLFIGGGAGAAACPTDSVQPFGADSAYSSNVALYQLDSDGGTTNNVPDTVGNHNGTATNVTYSTGQFGNAAVFNGSSSYVAINNSTDLQLAGTDYSISFWFNANNVSHSGRLINKDDATDFSGGYVVMLNSNATLTIGHNDGSNNQNWNPSNTFSANTWYHIVVTYSDSANLRTLYINGSLAATVATNTNIAASSDKLFFGTFGASSPGGQYFNGKLDQVRIYDKALSSDEVGVLYNETTSTASDTNVLGEGSGVALYSLNYDASDAGGNYDGTPTDVDFGVDGHINYGASFNGSSSYIDTGQINFGANNISVSLWVHPNASQNAYANIIDYNHSSSGGWTIQQDNTSTNSYKISIKDGSSYKTSSAFSLTSNQWNHIVFTVTSAGAYSIYVDNGTPITGTGLTGLSTSTNNNLNIGRWYSGTSRYWGGSIDQVRIFKKALSSSEVSTLYGETACVYTSTTDIVDYQGTNLAYYKLDNSAEDETGSYDGTETDITYEFGRYGQAAVFNGSSSYIDLGTSLLGSKSAFSVSTWVNFDNLNTQNFIFYSSLSGTGFQGGFYDYGNGSIYFQPDVSTSANRGYISNSGIYTTDEWVHIVMVFDGSATGNSNRLKAYIQGTERTLTYQGTIPSSTGTSTANSWIGGRPATKFSGKIDQVRIFDSALDATAVDNLYNEKQEINTSNFETVLYEGNGGSQYVSNVGFEPDLVWIKHRDSSANHHVLFDSVRGAGNRVISNLTIQEDTGAGYGVVSSFETNGFYVDSQTQTISNNTNKLGDDYVAWCWKAGGDAVLNEQGTIDSQVSANTAAGFSIVKWTGDTTSNPTVGHGLNQEPDLYIVKELDNGTVSWLVGGISTLFPETASAVSFLRLNTGDDIDQTGIATFGNSGDDLIKVGSRTNNGEESIAYCFHSVAGYQKIGSYTGTGTSGKVVTTGFKPKFLMIKNTTTINTGWVILDAARGGETQNSNALFASLDIAEWGTNTTMDVDFTSTGFIIQNGYVIVNSLYDTYIYLAIA